MADRFRGVVQGGLGGEALAEAGDMEAARIAHEAAGKLLRRARR